MSGTFIARPLTDVQSLTFTNGNTKRNNEDLRKWIQTQELTRSQIVSITAGETSPEEGDSHLTIYYRKKPIVTESPLVNIDFATGEMQLPWDVLLDQANSQAPANVIQFSRTPKNIGASNVQTIWYTNQTAAPCQYTLITGGDFEEVCIKMDVLLNKSIAPHQHKVRTIICTAIAFIVGHELGVDRNNWHERGPRDNHTSAATRKLTIDSGSSNSGTCPSVMEGPGVPTFKTRSELGRIAQAEGFAIGVELGVQNGYYSKEMLSSWPGCEEYHLVDLWGHQENYDDVANVNMAAQEKIYRRALESTSEWREKVAVCRNYTTSCVDMFDDEYFDFIYVDARHDFKGVWDDVVAYWPKLKVGGIMAGHDYVTNDDGPRQSGQDWTKNYDGTIDETGTVVKGAIDIFAQTVCRQVTVAYRESLWNTWAIRKQSNEIEI